MLLELGFELYLANRTWGMPVAWAILAVLLGALIRSVPPGTMSRQLMIRIVALGVVETAYSLLVVAWMTSHGGPADAAPKLGAIGFVQAAQTLPVASMILVIVTDRRDATAAWIRRWFDRAAIAATLGAIALTMGLIWT